MSSLKMEQNLIMQLCKFYDDDISRVDRNLILEMIKKSDMPYVLGQLLYNRMGGAAYLTLKKLDILSQTNREFRNTLKAIYESNQRKTISFHKCLDYLSTVLEGIASPYAILKGGYLCDLYPRGLRTSNDVDILVGSDNLVAICKALSRENFIQGKVKDDKIVRATRNEVISSRMNRGEVFPFVKEVGLPEMKYFEVDVNFSVDYKPVQGEDIARKLLLNSNNRIMTQKGSMRTLEKEEFLIHLCLHLFKEATVYPWVEMGRDLSLYKFMDIYLLLKLWPNDIFKASFVDKVKKLEVQNECYFALKNTSLLFGLEDKKVRSIVERIKPLDMGFMNKITCPKEKKTYFYKGSISKWLFTPNRKEHLYVIEA